jgi:hypothetical protein
VTAIGLLCLVLLHTHVQLDCSLVALQAGLLFTPVDACSVRLLFIVLQLCNFEDPSLEPPTHSCENILIFFELYEIEISVAACMPAH